MASLNIASLVGHIDELRAWIKDKNLDLLAISETRLDNLITDDQVYITGYNIIRHDRNRNGGGVAIYIRSTSNFINRSNVLPDNTEAICVDIKKYKSKSFSVIACYRLPNYNPDVFYTGLQTAIERVDNNFKELDILGDLNSNLLHGSENRTSHLLTNLCEVFQLNQ